MFSPRRTTPRPLPRLCALAALTALAALAGGCASSDEGGGAAMTLSGADEQAGYEAAFQAARDELRDRGYLLERVDSQAGVITTQRTGLPSGVEDVLNRQRHFVRVTFSPPADEQGAGEGADASPAGGRVMTVRVITERVHRPGWRVPTSSVRLASAATDPALDDRGLRPVYAVPVSEDAGAAQDIAAAISRRTGSR